MLTQAELAQRAGVGHVTIVRLEKGEPATLPIVPKLAAPGVEPVA